MNSQEAKKPTGRPMTSPANVINTLLAEMGAIRQETIESRDVKYNPGSGIGKDVITIIGRIEKGGLTRPKTSGIPSSWSESSHGPQPPKASSSSTAHVYSNKGSSSNGKTRRPAPKTPRSSSRPNVTIIPTSNSSSQFASAYSSSSSPAPKLTASARSFTEDRQRASTGSGSNSNSKKDVPPRPSTSFYRPYQSQPFKLKTTKSTIAPTILKTFSQMGEAGGDATAAAAEKISAAPTLKEQFAAFSAFGDKTSDGKSITLTNCDKWMKQAKVIDGKKITTTDTSITFKKLFKTAKKVSFEDFKKYIEELANSKKIEKSEIEEKLINCGPPGISSATRAAHTGVVERLTDTKKYTGSHKERFDATGKGRGIEGRRDVPKSASPGGVVRPKPASGTATPEKNGAASPSPVPPVSNE